jgi:multidrug efflux system outer membrane protein
MVKARNTPLKARMRVGAQALRATRLAAALTAAALLSACGALGTGPDYKRPALTVPDSLTPASANAHANAPASEASPAAVDWLVWWKGFQDPALNTLMDEALARNQDLALASARIAEALATLGQNEANLYPTLDLNAGATRKRSSENTSSFSQGSNPISEDRVLGLNASYEIDIWGKYARADDAARARLLAQTANRGTVITTLTANVAQSYFALRALDAQVQLAHQTLSTRFETLRLQQRRFEAGVVGELDVRLAESEMASVQSTLQQAMQGRSNAESALALLAGRQPVEIVRPELARGDSLGVLYARQAIPANLPSDVLARRPDIVAAEQNLIAANADIGQARSAYFPKVSITASLGQQSSDMATLLDPASMFWNLAANLTQPIFRAGAIGALVAATNARQQQALAQYTQTVQGAFREVHDAQNNVKAGNAIANTTGQRITALRNTLRLAELRYRAGYSGYLEVLSAQRDLTQAEFALVDVQRSQLAAVVSLYRALGGGWDAASVKTAR